jgi:hypothetical protein
MSGRLPDDGVLFALDVPEDPVSLQLVSLQDVGINGVAVLGTPETRLHGDEVMQPGGN